MKGYVIFIVLSVLFALLLLTVIYVNYSKNKRSEEKLQAEKLRADKAVKVNNQAVQERKKSEEIKNRVAGNDSTAADSSLELMRNLSDKGRRRNS